MIGLISMLVKMWNSICRFFSLSKNWLLYGVMWALIPFGLLYLCKWIIGYKVDFLELVPDVLLIVAAISVNLVGCIADSSAKTKGKAFIRGVSWSVMGLCWVIYLCLFSDFTAPDILTRIVEQGHPEALRWGTRIALFIIVVLGCIFKSAEYRSQKSANASDGIVENCADNPTPSTK